MAAGVALSRGWDSGCAAAREQVQFTDVTTQAGISCP